MERHPMNIKCSQIFGQSSHLQRYDWTHNREKLNVNSVEKHSVCTSSSQEHERSRRDLNYVVKLPVIPLLFGNLNKFTWKKSQYECKLCTKMFTTSSHLQILERTCSGVKPCWCKMYHTTFRCSSHHWRHKTSHLEKKIYKCKRYKKCSATTVTYIQMKYLNGKQLYVVNRILNHSFVSFILMHMKELTV